MTQSHWATVTCQQSCVPFWSLQGRIHFFIFYRPSAFLQFSSVRSLSHVQVFVTPWTAARQAALSITSSWSLLRLMSTELVLPSNHLILCRPLLLLPSIFPSIRVFSSESVLCIRWPKYWSFSISPSNEHSGLVSFRMESMFLSLFYSLSESYLSEPSSFVSSLSPQLRKILCF